MKKKVKYRFFLNNLRHMTNIITKQQQQLGYVNMKNISLNFKNKNAKQYQHILEHYIGEILFMSILCSKF